MALLGAVWASSGAGAACLTLAPPDDPPLVRIALDDRQPTFRVTYTHSVTRTPVDELYRVDGGHIVETEIRFVEHGPGLPTAPDAGGTFERRDGRFVVRGERSFERIVMRVHADQHPTLIVDGHAFDLARYGNRALVLSAQAGACSAS